MNKDIMMCLGRVVKINYGPLADKIAVVIDIVNDKKVIINGPTLGVKK